MAIGDVRIPTARANSREPRQVQGQFGEGVARALSNLSGNIKEYQQVSELYAQRDREDEDFETQRRFIEYEGELSRLQQERVNSISGDAKDFTNATQQDITLRNQEFLQTIPERQRPEYANRLERILQAQTTGAFVVEQKTRQSYQKQELDNVAQSQAESVYVGDIDPEEAMSEVDQLITRMSVTDVEKTEIRRNANRLFQEASFKRDVKVGLDVREPVRSPDEDDVVASGLGPGERAILNVIAKPESGGRYNVRYDGSPTGAEITDFSDHPRIKVKQADGRTSDAAGRYMFLSSTWDVVAAKLGLEDFSPHSQDIAAAYYAKESYDTLKPAGAPEFNSVVASGDRSQLLVMKEVLTPRWVGLGNLSDDEFIELFSGDKGVAGGGTGVPTRPDIWNDPKYSDLTYEDKLSLHQKAQSEWAAQAAEAKKQRDARIATQREEAMRAFRSGNLTEEDIPQLQSRGIFTTYDHDKQARSAIEAHRNAVDSIRTVGTNLANPSYVFTGGDDEALNRFIGAEGLKAIGGLDYEYVTNQFGPTVQRAGFIPSEAASVLGSMAQAGTQNQQDYALNILGSFYETNPQIIQRSPELPSGVKKQAGLYASLKGYRTQEQMNELMTMLRDPNYQERREKLTPVAIKEFRKEINVGDLYDEFDSIGTDEPIGPAMASQLNIFQKEAEMLYAEGYVLAQDHDAAKKYMVSQLGLQWGSTTIGGERYMIRNGPEKFYPTIEGEHKWMEYLVRRDLEMAEDEVFQLVPDGQTLMEGDQYKRTGKGNNASFMIARKKPDGTWGLQMNADGKVYRMAFDPDDQELTQDREWMLSYEQIGARVKDEFETYVELNEQLSAASPETRAEILPVRDATYKRYQELAESQKVMLESRSNPTYSRNDPVNNGRRLASELERELASVSKVINTLRERGKVPSPTYLSREKELQEALDKVRKEGRYGRGGT